MMRAAKNRYLYGLVCLSASLAGQAANVKRVEQNDPGITYTGTWSSDGASSNSGGSAAFTNSLNATATISFTGTGITWIGVKDPNAGLATVYLDGTQYTVDTYGSTTQYQQPLFTARGLGGGKHTLSIQILHQRDGDANGTWVWIDALDIDNGEATQGQVLASAGLVQQNDPALTYTGKWFLINNPAMSGGSAVESTDVPSSVTLAFEGSGVQWIAYRDQYSGIAKVYIDGDLVATMDTYSPVIASQTVAFSVDNLKHGNNGAHTITIEVTGTQNPSSAGAWVWADAFQVTGK